MKSNKGVTLIALVITIIVLLILAGVSISLVVGDSGVFTRGRDATTKTQIAGLEEALNRAVASAQGVYTGTDYFSSGSETFFEWLDEAADSYDNEHDKIEDVLRESGYEIKVCDLEENDGKLDGFICEVAKGKAADLNKAKGLNFQIDDAIETSDNNKNNRLKFDIEILNEDSGKGMNLEPIKDEVKAKVTEAE